MLGPEYPGPRNYKCYWSRGGPTYIQIQLFLIYLFIQNDSEDEQASLDVITLVNSSWKVRGVPQTMRLSWQPGLLKYNWLKVKRGFFCLKYSHTHGWAKQDTYFKLQWTIHVIMFTVKSSLKSHSLWLTLDIKSLILHAHWVPENCGMGTGAYSWICPGRGGA